MASYGIAIERKDYLEPVDMAAVQQSLAQAGVSVEEVDEEVEKVIVNQYDVAKAVKAINGLGYETDEDD